MDKKTLAILLVSLIVAFVVGFGGIWVLFGNQSSHPTKHPHAEKHSKDTTLTSTIDLFNLTMPCQRNANGDTPVVHADFQLVVPISQRLKVEENTSRISDLIATILRNSDIAQVNNGDLIDLKQKIIDQTRDSLGVEITEVLVLRFEYNILKQKHPASS
jgi:flagellar basal body-associated protein FliL